MTAVARFNAPAPQRLALAKVHIAKKELAMDDGAYRAMLERLTGHTSAKDCSVAQLGRVLDEMKAKGWNSSAKPKARPADHPSAKKARAMWISLHQLGVVRNASDAALEAFARRQLHVEQLQWADQGLTYKLIEALKAMAERAGWSQDLTGYSASSQLRVLKGRLAAAQAEKIGGITGAVTAIVVSGTDGELDALIHAQAARIWAAEAAGA